MALRPGLEARAEVVVGSGDLAVAHGSGDVEVFATPALVALCERAAVLAVQDGLDAGATTVGVRIDLEHLAPTTLGRRVTAHAVLRDIDGRTLRFDVEASDGEGPVGRGTHVRVVLDRERFEASARARG